MQKRLQSLALLLVLLAALSGCAEADPARAKEYGYFVYPGLDWAMGEDETLAALKLEKEALEFKDEPAPGGLMGSHYYVGEAELLGEPVEIKLWLMRVPTDTEYRLLRVDFGCREIVTREQYSTFCAKLEKTVAEQGIPIGEPTTLDGGGKAEWTLRSAARKQDLPETARKAYAAASRQARDFLRENGGTPPEQALDDPLAFDASPLSECSLTFSEAGLPGGWNCIGQFNGNIGVDGNYLNYIKMYEEISGTTISKG